MIKLCFTVQGVLTLSKFNSALAEIMTLTFRVKVTRNNKAFGSTIKMCHVIVRVVANRKLACNISLFRLF